MSTHTANTRDRRTFSGLLLDVAISLAQTQLVGRLADQTRVDGLTMNAFGFIGEVDLRLSANTGVPRHGGHAHNPGPGALSSSALTPTRFAFAPGGAIVLRGGGAVGGPGADGAWLARIDAHGVLDPLFGGGGYAEGASGLRISRVFVDARGGTLVLATAEGGRLALECNT